MTRDEAIAAVADLLARQHGPGGHWQRLADVRPVEALLIIHRDATLVVDLLWEPLAANGRELAAVAVHNTNGVQLDQSDRTHLANVARGTYR